MEESAMVLIDQLRRAHGDEDTHQKIRLLLIQLGKECGIGEMVRFLESLKRGENLEVKWELEEVIDTLDPPKKSIEDKDAEEDEDNASGRKLRASELHLCYSDPKGLRIYQSKVDERWVVMQPDPRTGGMVQQELGPEQGKQIQQQLMETPYWVGAYKEMSSK